MQLRISKLVGKGVLAVSLGLLWSAASANLVINGGFETGNFTGWNQTGDTSYLGVDGSSPKSGSFAAYFGPPQQVGGIQQTLSTIAGASYQLEFWLKSEPYVTGTTPNSFEVSWDGGSVTSLADASDFDYTQFSYTVVASGITTALQFSFMNLPSFWDLDDVSVNLADNNDVPEPGILALVGLAGAAAMSVRRRRRFSSAT